VIAAGLSATTCELSATAGGSVLIPSVSAACTLNVATVAASASQSTVTGVFTTATQAFVAGTMVTISGTVPTGFSAGTVYYVIAAGLTTTACELSANFGGSVLIPSVSGACTLTVETGIQVPSNVTIYGPTRQVQAAIFQPYQCSSFFLDGSGPKGAGNYVEDIWMNNFYIDYQYGIGTNIFYVNNTYTVKVRDVAMVGGFSNVPIYTNTMGIYGSSGDINVIFDDVSLYGNSSHIPSSPVALNIQKNGGTVTFIDLDVEWSMTGIYNGSANSTMDFFSVYSEGCNTYNYNHSATGNGQANFFGGSLQGGTGNAYCVNIAGDNLLMQGVTIPSAQYVTAAFQTPVYSFAASTGTSFKNVKIYGMNWQSGQIATLSTANLASVDFGQVSNITQFTTGTAYNSKSLTHATPANIFSFYAQGMMSCKLTIMAYQTNAFAATAAEYIFCIPNNGLGAQAAPTLMGGYNAVNSTVNTVAFSAPTLTNPSNNKYTFGLTATNSGSGGTTPTIKCYARLEWMSFDGLQPGINIIVAEP
jgi:hypothetical protein